MFVLIGSRMGFPDNKHLLENHSLGCYLSPFPGLFVLKPWDYQTCLNISPGHSAVLHILIFVT